MDVNIGTTIIFIRRYKTFLTAVCVCILSCIVLFQLSTSNQAYFSILSNNSRYSLFSNTHPKITVEDTHLSTSVSNFLRWIDGLHDQINTLTAQLECVSSDFAALEERRSGLQDSLDTLFEVFEKEKKVNLSLFQPDSPLFKAESERSLVLTYAIEEGWT